MLDFHRILFPVDFSSKCMQTVPYVAAIARKFQSEIVLLHVLDIHRKARRGASSLGAAAYAAYENEIREGRLDELECFGQSEFEGVTLTHAVETGDPAGTIVHYADKHQSDLIAMPTHGQGRFRQLLLGSVTAKVLHDTERPVWTTAHSEMLPPNSIKEIQRMICAVDSSLQSAPVVRAASEIAGRYGATVKLVHAIPVRELKPAEASDVETPLQRFFFEAAKDRIAELQREANTDREVGIAHGEVASIIRAAVLSYGAQLTVIGRGRITALLGRLRSNVSAIIRESPCPVLSI